jgi:hypothetical protein
MVFDLSCPEPKCSPSVVIDLIQPENSAFTNVMDISLDLEANNGNNACVESNLADAFAAICDDIEGGEDYADDHDEDEDQTKVEG